MRPASQGQKGQAETPPVLPAGQGADASAGGQKGTFPAGLSPAAGSRGTKNAQHQATNAAGVCFFGQPLRMDLLWPCPLPQEGAMLWCERPASIPGIASQRANLLIQLCPASKLRAAQGAGQEEGCRAPRTPLGRASPDGSAPRCQTCTRGCKSRRPVLGRRLHFKGSRGAGIGWPTQPRSKAGVIIQRKANSSSQEKPGPAAERAKRPR